MHELILIVIHFLKSKKLVLKKGVKDASVTYYQWHIEQQDSYQTNEA